MDGSRYYKERDKGDLTRHPVDSHAELLPPTPELDPPDRGIGSVGSAPDRLRSARVLGGRGPPVAPSVSFRLRKEESRWVDLCLHRSLLLPPFDFCGTGEPEERRSQRRVSEVGLKVARVLVDD